MQVRTSLTTRYATGLAIGLAVQFITSEEYCGKDQFCKLQTYMYGECFDCDESIIPLRNSVPIIFRDLDCKNPVFSKMYNDAKEDTFYSYCKRNSLDNKSLLNLAINMVFKSYNLPHEIKQLIASVH